MIVTGPKNGKCKKVLLRSAINGQDYRVSSCAANKK